MELTISMNNFNFLSLILEIIKLLGHGIIFQAAVIKSLLQKFLWKSNFRNARKNTFYRRKRALNFLFIASSHFGCNPLNLRFDIDFLLIQCHQHHIWWKLSSYGNFPLFSILGAVEALLAHKFGTFFKFFSFFFEGEAPKFNFLAWRGW